MLKLVCGWQWTFCFHLNLPSFPALSPSSLQPCTATRLYKSLFEEKLFTYRKLSSDIWGVLYGREETERPPTLNLHRLSQAHFLPLSLLEAWQSKLPMHPRERVYLPCASCPSLHAGDCGASWLFSLDLLLSLHWSSDSHACSSGPQSLLCKQHADASSSSL